MDIDTLLTVTQKLQIQTIIKRQCDVYARIEEINNELYYEPYTKSRKRHDITAAVISGFRPGATEINDCIISECRYGRGYAQPEINTGKVILHISQ